MLEKLKHLNKKTKRMLIGFLIFFFILGGTGISMYANAQQQKELLMQQVREVSETLNIPSNGHYNDAEAAEFNDLITKKEQAIANHDIETLKSLQGMFDELHNKVDARLQQEAAQQAGEEAKRAAEEENNAAGGSDDAGGSNERGYGNRPGWVDDKIDYWREQNRNRRGRR